MKYTIYTLFLLLGCSSVAFANEDDTKLTINQAIRIAADQQIQSQRVGRVYLSLCNDMMEPKFYQERDAVIELFDAQLRQLSYFVPNDEIRTNLQRVRDLWGPYKKIAEWSIKKDAASKLLKQSTSLLQATKMLYNSYVHYQKSTQVSQQSSDLITINEYVKQNTKQQILMQRMVMFYLASKQSIDAQTSNKTLQESQKVFLRMLNVLEKAKISSNAIQTDLASVHQEWNSLAVRFENVNSDQDYMREFYHSANHVASLLNKISVDYEDLATKLNLSHSLNDAITQTVLVQKIAKSYIATRSEVLSYQHRKLVNDYVSDFEQGVEAMLHSAPTDDIVRDLKVVQTMWKNYKRIVTDFESIDEIRIVRAMELCYVVMASCDRVTLSVRQYAESIPAYQRLYTEDGVTVAPSKDITYHIRSANNLCGYTERIALYFMLKNSGVDKDLSCKRLEDCIKDFENTLEVLSNSTLNTIAAQKLIESCQNEWIWIKSACKSSKSEDLLLMMDNASLLGKKLAKLSKLYEYKMNDLFAEDLNGQHPPTASAPSLKVNK